jgi:hypothetical protein
MDKLPRLSNDRDSDRNVDVRFYNHPRPGFISDREVYRKYESYAAKEESMQANMILRMICTVERTINIGY